MACADEKYPKDIKLTLNTGNDPLIPRPKPPPAKSSFLKVLAVTSLAVACTLCVLGFPTGRLLHSIGKDANGSRLDSVFENWPGDKNRNESHARVVFKEPQNYTLMGRNPAYLVEAQNGVVATENKRCSDIGVGVLRRGGSAVDAAIAATLCIGVVL